MRSREAPMCNQQVTFLKQLFHERMRVDRRRWTESREVELEYNPHSGVTLARLGATKVLCFIEAEVGTPRRSNRPGAGSIQFSMEVLSMATSSGEGGSNGEVEECLIMLETLYRDSYCIDFDTLCIEMNEYVVDLRCTLRVLDHDGGLFDCCSLAVTSALAVFRRNDITYDSIAKRIIVHPADERPMIPLTLYHKPLTITFGFIEGISEPIVDPAGVECALITGSLVIGANHRSEICLLHQSGKLNLTSEILLKCSNFALAHASRLMKVVEQASATRRTSA